MVKGEKKPEKTAYVEAREKLIPEASRHANELMKRKYRGGMDKASEVWRGEWNKIFHTKMEDLVKEKLKDENGQWIRSIAS